MVSPIGHHYGSTPGFSQCIRIHREQCRPWEKCVKVWHWLGTPPGPLSWLQERSLLAYCVTPSPQGWHWAGGKSRVRGVKCYQGKCKLAMTTGAESMFSLTPGPLIFHKVKWNMAAASPGRVLIRLFKEGWNKHTHKHTVSCCYRIGSQHGFAWIVFFLFSLAYVPPSWFTHLWLLPSVNRELAIWGHTAERHPGLSNTHPHKCQGGTLLGCFLARHILTNFQNQMWISIPGTEPVTWKGKSGFLSHLISSNAYFSVIKLKSAFKLEWWMILLDSL